MKMSSLREDLSGDWWRPHMYCEQQGKACEHRISLPGAHSPLASRGRPLLCYARCRLCA